MGEGEGGWEGGSAALVSEAMFRVLNRNLDGLYVTTCNSVQVKGGCGWLGGGCLQRWFQSLSYLHGLASSLKAEGCRIPWYEFPGYVAVAYDQARLAI